MVGYSVRMNCLCVMDNSVGDHWVCDRTDPHPCDYGGDSEGHHWVKATAEQWRAARELALQQAQ